MKKNFVNTIMVNVVAHVLILPTAFLCGWLILYYVSHKNYEWMNVHMTAFWGRVTTVEILGLMCLSAGYLSIYLSTLLFLKVRNTNASLRALEWIGYYSDHNPMIVDRKNFFTKVFYVVMDDLALYGFITLAIEFTIMLFVLNSESLYGS